MTEQVEEDERSEAMAQEVNRAIAKFVKKAGPLKSTTQTGVSDYITAIVRVALNAAVPLIWNYAVDTVAEAFEEGDPRLELTDEQLQDVAKWIRDQK